MLHLETKELGIGEEKVIVEQISSQDFIDELKQIILQLIDEEQLELQRQAERAKITWENERFAVVPGLDREPKLPEPVIQQIQALFQKYETKVGVRELQMDADILLRQLLGQGLSTELKAAIEREIYKPRN